MKPEHTSPDAAIRKAADAAALATQGQPADARADAIEHAMAAALEKVPVKSTLYTSGDEDPTALKPRAYVPGKVLLMDEEPRLAPMPEKPTLADFFEKRFRPSKQHLLQSAALAMRSGLSEKIVLACLLHDIAVVGFIQADHGYWGAQLVEPYVDEEVAWAIRYHQALRFFPDPEVGYEYPELYVKYFGADYRPSELMRQDYERARKHKWYMSARQVTMNDLYAFDADTVIELEQFTDLLGRNFRQPKEGLGNDHSPSAHMWRTIIAPTRFL